MVGAYSSIIFIKKHRQKTTAIQFLVTVEPCYNEDLGTMEITLLYQVSPYIRVKKQGNTKSWDQQNDLVITVLLYLTSL